MNVMHDPKLQAVAGYIPDSRISNLDSLDAYGVNSTFLNTKIGVLNKAVKAPEEDTSDLAVHAMHRLADKVGIDVDDLQVLVLVTQNPDGRGLPHASAIAHGKLGLARHCACFDVSLGCSGFVYGLSILRGFMVEAGLTRGALVTADPYSKVVDPGDRNTALLFGDAAAAALVSTEAGGWRPRAARFTSIGEQHEYLAVRPDGRLHMNGREIYNFVATTVPGDVQACLEAADLTMEEIDEVVLHQGSKYIVDSLRRRLKLREEQTRFEAGDYGNTVSSSIPLMLEDRLSNLDLNHLMLCGFGVGLSCGTMVLERDRA